MPEGIIRGTVNTINGWVHRFLPPGSLTRSVALIAGGSAVGQAISVGAMPILTRLYSPEDFGVMGVYNSLLFLLLCVASAKYELAITLPRKDRSAIDVLWLCVCVLLTLVVGCTILLWLIGPRLFSVLNATPLQPYGFLLPLGLLGGGLYNILSYWAIRRRAYKRLAQTRVTQSVSNALIGVGIGLFWSGPLGLLLGLLAMQTAGVGSLTRELIDPTTKRVVGPSPARILAVTSIYGSFAAMATAATLLCTLGMNLPNLMLAPFYGAEVTGWFNLAHRTVLVPMTLVGGAITQIFLGEASEIVRTRPADLPGLFHRFTIRTLRLSGAVIGIGLVAPLLFGLIFGAQWQPAGLYALLLSFCAAGQLVVGPISNIVSVTRRQDVQLRLDAFRLAVVLLALYVPYRLGCSATTAVLSYSLAMMVVYVIFYATYQRLTHSLLHLQPISESPT